MKKCQITKKKTININFINQMKSNQNNNNLNKKHSIKTILKKNTISFDFHQSHHKFFQNILRERNIRKKKLKNQITKDKIIKLLSMEPCLRTSQDNREIAIFLSHNYDFFKKIKEEAGIGKLDKLTSILYLSNYNDSEIVINYGEKLNRVFIVMQGSVNVYTPIYIEKMMTPNDFLKILSHIENKQNDYNKSNRIKEKNRENSLDITSFENMNPKEDIMRRNFVFYVEELKKIDSYTEGKAFGEEITEDKNNNINNNNIIVKCNEESKILYYDIEECKRISKKYEEMKFKKEIEKFKSEFPFFKYFNDDKIMEIFNSISTKTLFKDEYLYNQNEKADKIFFIIKGKFNMYSSISFNWLIEYLDYIRDSKTNLIYHLIKKFPKTANEINDLIDEVQNKVIKSPMIRENLSNIEKIIQKENENYIYGIKTEEESINRVQKIFKLNIKNIKVGDMVGIEDSIELKNRYCSVKCISDVAEVKYISIYDFIKIIKVYKNENYIKNHYLLEYISKIKFMLYQQIIKVTQNVENNLTFQFDTKYDNLIPNGKILSMKEKNKSVAAIKVKGYKYDIKEVFDKNIPLFPDHKKSESENYYEKNQILLKNLLGSQKKHINRSFKYKQQKSNPKLFLDIVNSNCNTISIENLDKLNLNTERKESNRYLAGKFRIPYISKNKEISLSTNFTINNNNQNNYFTKSKNERGKIKLKSPVNKIIKSQKAIDFFNNQESIKIFEEPNISNYKNKNIYKNKLDIKKFNDIIYNTPISGRTQQINCLSLQSNRFNSSNKRINKECIESILNEQFNKINKRYYLGNQFKNKLDKVKKQFKLIQYKEFYNKK